MLQGYKIVVVMPAYNAAATLGKTYEEVIAQEVVDHVILVDDCSSDDTVRIAQSLEKVHIHKHERNLGYGGNQKTCYQLALQFDADVVIMVHPDYQYTPLLIPAIAGMIVNGVYDCVLASRMLGKGALQGGMPWWKYLSNRFLTICENFLLNANLSEYHTGYRGFSRRLLSTLNLQANSDNFVFDNQIITQTIWMGYAIGEVSCPTLYHPEASSVNFRTSLVYGWGCLVTAMTYRLARWGLIRSRLFDQPLVVDKPS